VRGLTKITGAERTARKRRRRAVRLSEWLGVISVSGFGPGPAMRILCRRASNSEAFRKAGPDQSSYRRSPPASEPDLRRSRPLTRRYGSKRNGGWRDRSNCL